MATVRDQIYGALRLLGQLAEGEIPSAETAQDALTAFNQMCDSWNTARLHVYSTQDQVFTWTAGFSMRTLGPSGNFVGNRPIQVDDSTYFKVSNLSYSLYMVNQDQYNGISLKSATSTYPNVMFVNYTMPDIEMYIWPVPTTALEMHIISIEELTQPANLSDTLIIPPGYLRAFRFNLACEIAAEFGVEPSSKVQRIADVSLRSIKRINNPNDVMMMPPSLVGRRNTNYNIFTGLPL